jgi:hypothetical protein
MGEEAGGKGGEGEKAGGEEEEAGGVVEEAGEVGGRLEGRDRRMKRNLRGLRDKKENFRTRR